MGQEKKISNFFLCCFCRIETVFIPNCFNCRKLMLHEDNTRKGFLLEYFGLKETIYGLYVVGR